MKKLAILALLVLCGCNPYVVTPTPTLTPPPPVQPSPTASPRPTATATDAGTATVRAAYVNVRQSPDGEVIGSLEAGTDVRVIGCLDGWCEVEADELTGWIYEGCLDVETERKCEAK